MITAHRPTMEHLPKNRSSILELTFQKQDISNSKWSNAYKFPSRGYSIAFQDYGNKEVLGQAISIYRFTKFSLLQNEKIGFIDFKLGNGISFITEKYDPVGNTKNTAIGTHLNGFINCHIGIGFDFTHQSNSAIKAPNLGINTYSGMITLGYDLKKRVRFNSSIPKPEDAKMRDTPNWEVHFFAGIKQNLPNFKVSRTFGVMALQGLYKKQLSFKWDLYSEANRWFYSTTATQFTDALQFGGYVGLAANIYKTQIYFGVGAYAFNPVDAAGWIYNRIGGRYLINDNWNMMVGIKAHLGIADYLEMGVGYRFN